MIHKNKYINSSKISEAQFRGVISYFVAGLSAIQISVLTGVREKVVT